MLTYDEVRKILPQKFPIIMVDRVVSCEAGRSIRTLKNISGNDLLLIGHFPDMAIFPGALLIEGVAQSAILLQKLSHIDGEASSLNEVYLFGAVKARFTHPVYPGDQVFYDVELVKAVPFAAFFNGKATVDGKIVALCELTMSTKQIGRNSDAA
jgi:3-hydroxyacyl-[acyl-carrier-protein] dehydratase